MKRLFLTAMLCVAALVAVPVASASAAETVACTFKGPATFPGKPLTPTPTPGTKYKFEAKEGEAGVPNECVGSVAGKRKVEEAVVEGEGKLSCAVSEEENVVSVLGKASGHGTLKVEGKEKYELTSFSFVGVGAEVLFKVKGHNASETITAEGSANFVKNASAVKECLESRLTSLNFEASALGETK